MSWSAKVNGQDTPVTQSARIIDGEWKLIDVNSWLPPRNRTRRRTFNGRH